MERMTPFETEKFKAYWHMYSGQEHQQWKMYFSESTIGESYFVLVEKDTGFLVMSNTEFEKRTNQPILEKAYGDVLLVGLGINLINDRVLAKEGVLSVDTVELYSDIIDNVDTNTTVIQADATSLNLNKQYDTIWFDGFCIMDKGLVKHLKKGGQLLSWNAKL